MLFAQKRLVGLVQGYLDQATLSQKAEGCTWYVVANWYARLLSIRYDMTVWQASALIATLSPNNAWGTNKADAERYATAARAGLLMPTAATYPPQRRKAWVIARVPLSKALHVSHAGWERMIGTDAARKTRAFARNIADPSDKECVTVDIHIMRALELGRDSLTANQYEAVAKAIRTVAQSYNCHAWKVQATVWVVQTDKHFDNIELPF